MSTTRAILDLPFERYLCPRALDVVARLWQMGEPAILSTAIACASR